MNYEGKDGYAVQNGKQYDLHDVRKLCLWGTVMAGGDVSIGDPPSNQNEDWLAVIRR